MKKLKQKVLASFEAKYVEFEKTNDRNFDFADIAVYFTGIPL